jgi:acyl-CoA synthetase (AMP-forming)/AMP-acid ligase II
MERKMIDGWSLRWDEARAREAYAQGWWTRATLADALAAAVQDDPERIVLIDGETHLSAAMLNQQSRAFAAALLARMTRGSVVSFMLPNWHEAAIVYLGATLAGMVAHPVLPSLRGHELRFMLADARSRLIVIPAHFRGHDYAAMLAEVVADMEVPPLVAVVRGDAGAHLHLDDLLTSRPTEALPALEPDAIRMIMYTSGTTGRPKGVLHSHNSLGALIRQIGAHWLVEPGDHFLVPSPISHIGGSIYAFEMPLMLGTTAILMDQWNADNAVALAARTPFTHMAGATPFLEQLLEAADKAGTQLPALKLFICGGASVPPALIRRASETFEHAIVSRVYGSTEVPVTSVGVIDRADIHHAAETDGRPGFARVIIADDSEVRAHGPQMLLGYLHQEDEDGAFDVAGFYRSGDQGQLVNGDYLVITGRIKDLIIRNGENIAPKEVEDLLLSHPDVADIAVVGLPDARTGERACAVIVPAGEARPDVATLRAFLDTRGVARFKWPEQVALLERLPRNDAGKVLKHVLRAQLAVDQP